MAHAHEGRDSGEEDIKLTSFPHPLGLRGVTYWVLITELGTTWFKCELGDDDETVWKEI